MPQDNWLYSWDHGRSPGCGHLAAILAGPSWEARSMLQGAGPPLWVRLSALVPWPCKSSVWKGIDWGGMKGTDKTMSGRNCPWIQQPHLTVALAWGHHSKLVTRPLHDLHCLPAGLLMPLGLGDQDESHLYYSHFAFLIFWNRDSLCNPVWPQTCDPPISTGGSASITGVCHPALKKLIVTALPWKAPAGGQRVMGLSAQSGAERWLYAPWESCS
jgi:hypothetical protein